MPPSYYSHAPLVLPVRPIPAAPFLSASCPRVLVSTCPLVLVSTCPRVLVSSPARLEILPEFYCLRWLTLMFAQELALPELLRSWPGTSRFQ